jgi:hypothetical protein
MPPGEMAAGAGGRSRCRASDADREQAVDLLKAAFVAGRLGKDEFDLRIGWALASRSFADLDAVTDDLPAGPTKARPPAPAREPGRKQLIMRASVTIAVAGVVAIAAVPMVRFPGAVGLITGTIRGCLVGALLAVLLTHLSRALDRGPSRRPSPGPAAGPPT